VYSVSPPARHSPPAARVDPVGVVAEADAAGGVGLPMLMTKSRHTSLASLAIYAKPYAKPTFDAVAAATAALDPDQPTSQSHG